MADLGIPPAYRAPLVVLARLGDEDASGLVTRIRDLAAYAPVPDIQVAMTEAVGDEGAGLAAALLSIRGLFRTMPAAELATMLSAVRDLDLDPDERENLGERVRALLVTDVLSTTAVAVDLQTQNERNYQSARILTDLRPVFADDLDEAPTGGVIVETLQLQTWSRDGTVETIFVAMDEKDLTQLRVAVDRALKKTATLRRFMDDHDLTAFQLEENE